MTFRKIFASNTGTLVAMAIALLLYFIFRLVNFIVVAGDSSMTEDAAVEEILGRTDVISKSAYVPHAAMSSTFTT